MVKWALDRVVLLVGTTALLSGLTIAVVGLVVYRSNMATNLLAGTSDLLIGIAVAILIVDRLNKAGTRQQWTSAYQALHGLLAATFVDVMRLLNVRSSTEAYAANVDRYDEFVAIATLHVDSLRSTIEGFAVALDPAVHTLCRKVEQRLSWMVRSLARIPGGPQVERGQFELMATTGQMLAAFITAEQDHRYLAAQQAADHALFRAGFLSGDRRKLRPEELMRYRLSGQGYMLEDNRDTLLRLQTIADDIDNDLAIYYFALDVRLLSELTKN